MGFSSVVQKSGIMNFEGKWDGTSKDHIEESDPDPEWQALHVLSHLRFLAIHH